MPVKAENMFAQPGLDSKPDIWEKEISAGSVQWVNLRPLWIILKGKGLKACTWIGGILFQ